MRIILLLAVLLSCFSAFSNTVFVSKDGQVASLSKAIEIAKEGDTIIVSKGIYREGNILIDKRLFLLGVNYPTIDGEKKSEVISIKHDSVVINGFNVINCAYGTITDPAGIKSYGVNNITIENNVLDNNFFGIYIQSGHNCIIKNNILKAYGSEEQKLGNGIHCWKSTNIQVIHNKVNGHRDGIYFEFVSESIIWRNKVENNIRYGLHFMFSHNNSYITNIFRSNGAGVAVMYTKNVTMINNLFDKNWGQSAYGLLLKEITDSYISNNKFIKNTTGVYMEGSNRIAFKENEFTDNGWAVKVQASCDDNTFYKNNFKANTFDMGTNGSLVLNNFDENYWDKYDGYDLNKDGYGDVPYHPLSLFCVLTERIPATMLLYRSFMITLLDKSEKVLPSITPDNFIDNKPLMKPLKK
jgi:nitrous oxidase accessory protein